MTDTDIEAIGREKAWRAYKSSFIFSTPKQLVAFARAVIDADRAQRVPLTDEQIDEIVYANAGYGRDDFRSCARAVERAHKIGAKP